MVTPADSKDPFDRAGPEIIVVTPSYFPNIGGVEKHVKEITERMAHSFRIEIFTIDHTLTMPETREVLNGITVRRFKSRRITYGIEIPSKEFVAALRESTADLIHLHSLHTMLPRYVAKVKRTRSCKLIITPHYHGTGHTFLRRILFGIYKRTLSEIVGFADKVICVSGSEMDLMLRDFCIQEDKRIIIPNGIEIPVMRDAGIKRQAGKLLFVGRLEKYKNADKIVEALSLLPTDRHYELTIVGDGPERENILQLAARLNLKDRVTVKGNLTRDQLSTEYLTSEILILPSYHEAYGIVVAEALCVGTKAIVANSSALSEFVRGGFALGVQTPITAGPLSEAILSCQIRNDFQTFRADTWDAVSTRVGQLYSALTSDSRANAG